MHAAQGPLVVEVHRGGLLESSHLVHAVVASTDAVEHAWGDADRLTMPRSAIKSIQVLPLLASGAADEFAVSEDEIALACSSHGAEDLHLDAVRGWLDRLDLTEDALECGPMKPLTPAAASELAASGQAPSRIHNCCSGKHTGFLTVTRHHDLDHRGYLDPSHPLQQLVTDAQAAFTGVDLASQQPAVDGCGIPVYRFPLSSLAQAMARLVTPGAAPAPYEDAAARVTKALPDRPLLVAGTGRSEVVLTEAASEPVILKGGAEGVYMAALPDRQLGIALKAEDGTLRAVDEAMAALLHALEVLPEPCTVHGPIRNTNDDRVGHFTTAVRIQPVP